MRICFLEGDMSRSGGTERMTALLANALSNDHDVIVVSLHMEKEKLFFHLNDAVRHIVLKPASGKLDILNQIHQIRKLLRRERAEIVINVDVGMGFYGILAAKGTGARVITWEHGNYYNNWGSRWFPVFRRFAARHSYAMVVLTEKDRENYLKNISRVKPVYVIPNPAEKHDFCYDADSRTILSAGLFLPIKGFDMAVEIASKVLNDRPQWQWVICGDGPEREKLTERIRQLGLENRVLLPGTVRDMDVRYAGAAIYAMTSRMEGLPMVLLEAKSSGLPLVSFNIMTGPSDIIRDDVNGNLIPAENVQVFADKLAALMDDTELRMHYSQASQLDMDKFAFSNILGKWMEVLSV